MRGDEFTQRGTTRSRSLLLADVLGLTLALRMRHFLELFLAHRRDHRLRCALELALRRFAALGGKRRARGFLLGSGFGWHFLSPQLARMKRSSSANASSSGTCRGGCLQKADAGAWSGPESPRSFATRAQRIRSIATPALLGESSTESRSSIFIGTPPNSWPSMRRQQTLLSFCQAT